MTRTLGLFLFALPSLALGCLPGPGEGAKPASSRVVEIALGGFQSCARMADGTAYCWGSNDYGQLGEPPAASERVPFEYPDNPHWGRRAPHRVAGLEDAAQLAVGGDHVCARIVDGTAQCWGSNASGQLGDGTTSDRSAPAPVAGLAHVAELAAGPSHTCARLEDGTVRCWGNNAHGELGDGTTTERAAPTEVLGLEHVVGLTVYGAGAPGAGVSSTTCAQLEDTTVRCWGGVIAGDGQGHVTASVTRPQPMRGLEGSTELRAGEEGLFALRRDGTLVLWNFSAFSTGEGPRWLESNADIVQLAPGSEHLCVLRSDGTVACKGDSEWGMLGDGARYSEGVAYDSPARPVAGLSNVVQLAAGDDHTCALEADGALYCWGRNFEGQVGAGVMDDVVYAPTRVVF